jgi:hypothetical protein
VLDRSEQHRRTRGNVLTPARISWRPGVAADALRGLAPAGVCPRGGAILTARGAAQRHAVRRAHNDAAVLRSTTGAPIEPCDRCGSGNFRGTGGDLRPDLPRRFGCWSRRSEYARTDSSSSVRRSCVGAVTVVSRSWSGISGIGTTISAIVPANHTAVARTSGDKASDIRASAGAEPPSSGALELTLSGPRAGPGQCERRVGPERARRGSAFAHR